MRHIKTTAYSIFLIILSILSSCGTSDISEVSNKMTIEIRTIGTIEEEDAKRELDILLRGVNLADKFYVPIIDVIDITNKIDSTKFKTSKVKIPLSWIDANSTGISDGILDQRTYEENLEDVNLEKDSAYLLGIKILTALRGTTIKTKFLPADPINSNEFFISNSSTIKTDTAKHIFSSSEDLLNYLKNSKRNDTKLILFFMGGKTPASLKDTDKDGVTDDIDTCKEIFGSKECLGCPCDLTKPQVPIKLQSPNQERTTETPNNCGKCDQKFNLQIDASNNSVAWNSCPSARFIYVDVVSSSGKFQKSYKLNGSSTNFTIPLSSESVIKNNPSIPLHDKFVITVKAECGSGKIIQSESKSKIKLKCS